MDEKYNIIEKTDINFAPAMKLLWSIEECEKKFPFLITIDPYGNTFFNVHQTPRLIQELKQLKQEKIPQEILEEINSSIEFIEKVEQHTFVKFIGD